MSKTSYEWMTNFFDNLCEKLGPHTTMPQQIFTNMFKFKNKWRK